jgi:2-(1,2-epoxy-1,2-dihydrophenyl)acetyl-CoA isomerase
MGWLSETLSDQSSLRTIDGHPTTVSYGTIVYQKQDGLATIILNRPQALNAFVPQMNQEVLDALKDSERDKDVRCLMITGAGRAFCAGQDLKGRTPEQKGSLGVSLREK